MKQIGQGPPVAYRSGREGLSCQKLEGKPSYVKYLVDPENLYIAVGQ